MAEQRFSVPSDPTKTAATQRTSPRAERAIKTGSRAPLSARTSERPDSATADAPHYSWRRANEEDSGFESAIRAEPSAASGAIKQSAMREQLQKARDVLASQDGPA
jgi:hypothetical protein